LVELTSSGFEGVLVYLIGGVIFILGGMLTAKLLRPSRPNEEKLTTYESGEDPVRSAWGQFNIQFYIVALIFLLFEVELVFLFPWAVVFSDQQLIQETNGIWGWLAFAEMTLFVGILVLGLAYVWRKGYLDWEKPLVQKSTFKGTVPAERYAKINEKYQ
jgi:NADH-quinone oxidoreductase subunit A